MRIKKSFCLVLMMVFFIACNNETNKTAPVKGEEKKGNAAINSPEYDVGLDLVAKSDCFSCHKLNEASVGPAYGDIAKKYENNEANISLLADKVIKGGQGVWGQVPMAAHPLITKEDAEKMVKYILLLKQ